MPGEAGLAGLAGVAGAGGMGRQWPVAFACSGWETWLLTMPFHLTDLTVSGHLT